MLFLQQYLDKYFTSFPRRRESKKQQPLSLDFRLLGNDSVFNLCSYQQKSQPLMSLHYTPFVFICGHWRSFVFSFSFNAFKNKWLNKNIKNIKQVILSLMNANMHYMAAIIFWINISCYSRNNI